MPIAAAAYLLGSIPVGYLLVRSSATRTSAPWAAATSAPPTCCAPAAKAWARPLFCSTCSRAAAAVWLGAALAAFSAPPLRLRDAQAARRALRRPRPHVHPLAAISRRQGRGHRLRRLSGRRALGRAGRHRRLRHRLRPHPLRLAGSIVGAASFPVFAWFLVHGDRPPFFIAVAGRRGAAHHRQAPPEHPPPARRHRIPLRLPPRKGSPHEPHLILGSGAWGTAIALSLHRRGGHQVTLWAHSAGRRPADRRGPRKHAIPARLSSAREHRRHRRHGAIADAEIWSPSFPRSFSAPRLLRLRTASAHRPVRRERHQGRRRPHLSAA